MKVNGRGMSDIELVIKIPEKAYNALTHTKFDANLVVDEMRKSIANGTPLPKGHGDLIDKDRLLDELDKTVTSVDDTNRHLLFWDRAVAHVHLSKPIIEADKEK